MTTLHERKMIKFILFISFNIFMKLAEINSKSIKNANRGQVPQLRFTSVPVTV